MKEAALKAGRSLLRDLGEVENLQVSVKGPGDFVSAADLRADKLILEHLKKAYPKVGFLSEESGEEIGEDAAHRWVIDPLDGTTNFLHGFPHFCVSIGLEEVKPSGNTLLAGVVYAPAHNEMFFAVRGEGAMLNDYKMSVSARKNLSECLVAVGSYGKKGEDGDQLVHSIKAVGEKAASVRVGGSSALELAYVAAGRLDAYWYPGLKPWDTAAAALLIQEAKGMVTDFTARGGVAHTVHTGNILATNGHIHDKLLKLTGAYLKR